MKTERDKAEAKARRLYQKGKDAEIAQNWNAAALAYNEAACFFSDAAMGRCNEVSTEKAHECAIKAKEA